MHAPNRAMERQRKYQRKQARSSPPLSLAEMLRLDNVVKHKAKPKELQRLKSSNSFALPDLASNVNLEEVIHKVDLKNGIRAWHIDGKQKVFRGLPVQEYLRQKAPNKVESPTLPLPPPSCPDWADQIYHPSMVPRISRPSVRRKNGKRLYPHFIWGGQDVRQPFFPSGYPWQCIGRVFAYADPSSFTPSWTGTGVLVGPNTVLTASHLVPWDANPGMIEFVPAYFNGGSTIGPNVSSFVDAASSYDPQSNAAPAFDFAILRLQDRLGDSLGWFGTRSYDDGWNDQGYWTLVGYAGDIDNAEQPSWQGSISFHDDDEDSNDFGDAMELETQNGDSTPGDSGGPYFAFWTDGPYVVGVDVGGEEEYFFFPFSTEDNNVASAGSALVQLVRWARDNWA